MNEPNAIDQAVAQPYRHGFVTDIESDSLPPGLDHDVVRAISRKKGEPQFLTDWRLKAFDRWLKMREPKWARVHHVPIDYQAISYYSAPKRRAKEPRRRRPQAARDLRKARRAAARTRATRGRRRRRRV
jgi:Fe-S cluster assembly protein SufB